MVGWFAENCTLFCVIITEMNCGSTITVIICIENMALRTQNSFFHSGICRIFNNWNTGCASNRSCFRKSLQGAPNVNNRSLLVSSVVTAKKYQTQTYNCVMKCIKKERSLMYSTSTSSLEEGKTLSVTGPLTKLQAHDLIMRLTREERTALLTALQEFQAEKKQTEYEGKIYYVSENESFRPLCFIYIYIYIVLKCNK